MKNFETKYGLFILDGCELTLAGSEKHITIENPDTLDENRLERIYLAIFDNGFDDSNAMDKLGTMAYGLEAILPQSF